MLLSDRANLSTYLFFFSVCEKIFDDVDDL